jgi:hypothetical protein
MVTCRDGLLLWFVIEKFQHSSLNCCHRLLSYLSSDNRAAKHIQIFFLIQQFLSNNYVTMYSSHNKDCDDTVRAGSAIQYSTVYSKSSSFSKLNKNRFEINHHTIIDFRYEKSVGAPDDFFPDLR